MAFHAPGSMLLDGGVWYLFAGVNSDSGGPPLPRLRAFWWKQPDGRRLLVWMSLTYGDGFFFFETEEWRRGPLAFGRGRAVSAAPDWRYLKTDEDSLRKAHQQCVNRLRQFEHNGYRLPVMVVSMTNMWRYDNDPPFPYLSDFVAAWNRLGLRPKLRLTTVTEAMQHLEQAAGDKRPNTRANGQTGGPTARPALRVKWRRAVSPNVFSRRRNRPSGESSTPPARGASRN